MRLIDKTKKFFITEKGNIGRRLLKLTLAAPFWVILCSLILTGTGIGRAVYLSGSRYEQRAAEIWQQGTDTSFRHMSVFAGGIRTNGERSPLIYSEGGSSIRVADLSLMRQSLQASANTGSGGGTYREGELRGWEDCYSSTVKASVTPMKVVEGKTELGSETDVELVAVGGNYRAFHPFRYMSGGFLPVTPVDTYQVVINDILAWKFYRSYDVTGNMIVIGGQIFTVIGVVEAGTSKVSELAGEQEPRAYIYFGALGSIYGNKGASAAPSDSPVDMDGGFGGGASGGSDYAIQCYEALLPELVKGVGIADFKNALPAYSLTNPQLYVSNDTERFSIPRVVDTMLPLGETEKERMGYEFPYWERAAQMTEQRLFYDFVITAFGILLLLIGVIMAALKIRASKAIAPEEITPAETDEKQESDEKDLMLKE